MMDNSFGFLPVHSKFIETEKSLIKIAGKYFDILETIGAKRKNKEKLDFNEPLFYFIVTGGTEKQLLELKKLRNNYKSNEPVFLIAHPTQNSLPASLETLARLQQDEIVGEILYLNGPYDKKGLEKIINAIEGIKVKEELDNIRIGLFGTPSDWLIASTPNPSVVKKYWGPEIVKFEVNEIKELLHDLSKEEISEVLNSLTNQANSIIEPENNDLENNVKVYLALKKIINKYKLDAITVRCFDLVLDIKTTGCFGLSQLNDDGYIAGCEGDLVSTIGMVWTYKLLNQIPWMANPAQVDIENNSLWLAHCTVPRSIVKNYDIRSHFESGLGVGIQGYFPNGPVTLLRIGGKNLEKIWLAEGEIIKTGNSEHLCRTQIEIKLTNGSITELLNSPLGNHLILVNGHNAERLKNWWEKYIQH